MSTTSLRESVTPQSPCPYCDYPSDRATSASLQTPNAVPTPGALSVCLSCASILVFTDDLRRRKPYHGEIEAIFATDKPFADAVRRAQRAVRQIDRRNLTFAKSVKLE